MSKIAFFALSGFVSISQPNDQYPRFISFTSSFLITIIVFVQHIILFAFTLNRISFLSRFVRTIISHSVHHNRLPDLSTSLHFPLFCGLSPDFFSAAGCCVLITNHLSPILPMSQKTDDCLALQKC